MFKWSLGSSIAAACLAAVALALSGHRAGMPWGDVSGWVGGVGSLAAAGVALWIGLDGNRRYRKDQAAKTTEARERAARRAKRVQLHARDHVGGDLFTNERRPETYLATIKNATSSPVYDLQWYPPVVVVPPGFKRAQKIYCATTAMTNGMETSVLAAEPRVLEPEHASSMAADLYPGVERGGTQSIQLTVYPVVAFDDDDGNRFGWTLDREVDIDGNTLALKGHWDFVDDNYPYECGGELRVLFDQAEGWSPQPSRVAPDA